MNVRRWVFLILIYLLVGCRAANPEGSQSPSLQNMEQGTATPQNLPTVAPQTTPVPDEKNTVRAYLDAWVAEDYERMYAMLTSDSQQDISLEEFTNQYQKVLAEAAIDSIDYEILSSLVQNAQSAQTSYRIKLHSVLIGDIQRDTVMSLTREDQSWKIQWSQGLILPELKGGNTLWMDRLVPSRANIYDREGNPIATHARAVSVGIIPGNINPEQEEDFLEDLQWLTGLHPSTIAAMYEDFPLGVDWYLPLGEVLYEKVAPYYDVENGYNDGVLLMYPYEARYYFDGGIAPQAIGYVSRIQADEEEEFLRQGFRRDEMVGRQGVEKWGESYLTGVRGGSLFVLDSENQVVTQMGTRDSEASQPIYTTLDTNLQQAAQTTLSKFAGAVVVMEIDTGRVLAMASSPWFDPNAFETTNFNYSYQLEDIYSPFSGDPLLNRASQGKYPLGSVFKIITMAAALESGLYTPQTTYNCQYTFTEIPSIEPRYDWTWEHFQEDDETLPSGVLTLTEGLMRSCNPYFWHIGLDLYRQGLTEAISEMARGFGLGTLTGIEGVEEEPGQIPEPGDEVDAINLAIGQGATLVTPLQVARFVAAIGNGGILYQPQIIDRIGLIGEEPIYESEPIVKGTLPISPDTLSAIQNAMVQVVQNRRGTAQHILGAFSSNVVPIAGKTGTAESGQAEPHAWFVGYTRRGRTDKPDIAVVIIAEHAGEGSDIAAPIFRAVVQQYFEGRRTYLLPWESSVGVLATPEPDETPTPEP